MHRRSNRCPRLLVAASLVSLSCFGQSISEIRDELRRMRALDQEGREEIARIEDLHGPGSTQLRSAWERQGAIDAANMQRLEEIVSAIGWPKQSVVGREAATGAFLILQHAELDTQRKYLAIFREAVDAGEAQASSYALLYDRVRMREGEKQLYGSQVRRDEATNQWYVWPIEAESQVNARRAEMGMPPLEDYLERFPFEIAPAPQAVIDELGH